MKPRNLKAENVYAQAWAAHQLTTDQVMKKQLEILMDAQQPLIADGPGDPRWKQFVKSLPGFLEFWKRWATEVREAGMAALKPEGLFQEDVNTKE